MTEPDNLPTIRSGTNNSLTRRKMVQRLLAGAGAGAAWPLARTSHPIYQLLANDAIFDTAEKLRDANWKPVFLSSQQTELLTSIAESIVPGSTRAQVSRFLDLLLSVEKPENQHKFVKSLTALDAEAHKRLGKSFPALNEDQKNALLTEVSAKPERPKDSEKDAAQAAQEEPTLYNHFENLKVWISGAYYSSEVGMRELGWTGDYVYEKFPGCAHSEGHH